MAVGDAGLLASADRLTGVEGELEFWLAIEGGLGSPVYAVTAAPAGIAEYALLMSDGTVQAGASVWATWTLCGAIRDAYVSVFGLGKEVKKSFAAANIPREDWFAFDKYMHDFAKKKDGRGGSDNYNKDDLKTLYEEWKEWEKPKFFGKRRKK